MTVPSFNINPGESADDVALRRKIAMQMLQQGMDGGEVKHWAQGAGKLANALVGGMIMRGASEEAKANERAGANALADHLMPQAGAAATPAAAPSPGRRMGAALADPASLTSPQTAPVKDVYEANEQSPLDPVPGAMTPNMKRLAAAVYPAESGGRPNVMYGGKTFDSYADHPRQPQPITSGPNAGNVSTAAGAPQFIAPTWDRAKRALNLPDFTPGNQNAAFAYVANDDYKKRTGRDLEADMTAAGNDPQKLAAIAKSLAPTWTSLPGGIEQTVTGPQFAERMTPGATDVSAQSRQPAGAAAVAPAPGTPPTPAAPAPAADMRSRIVALLRSDSPQARTLGRQLGMMLMQQDMTPNNPSFGVIGEDEWGNKRYGWIDPRKQKTTPAESTGGTGASAATGGAGAQPTVTGPDGKPVVVPPGNDPKTFRKAVTEANARAATGEVNETQGKARQFASRMSNAENDIAGIEAAGTKAGDRALGAAPFGLGRLGQSENYKKFDTARSQWITALLRRESGAAISPQEFERYDREFFPQPGDSADQIAQKRAARAVALQSLTHEGGPGFKLPASAGAAPVRVSTPEEARKLPSGTRIILPDGSPGVVP